MMALAAAAMLALPQEGTLDVLDGETLFEGGWLFTLGAEVETREGDPLDRRLSERTAALSAHYGLRYNVQLSAILPWVDRELKFDGGKFSANGPGDFSVVAKWRFYRWDDVGKAANFAVLAGLETPTGETGERSSGIRLPADLQPGSGSWDPSLGAAVTYEPGRWRFNAAALYQRNGHGAQDFKFGDEFFAEIAVGNRFWLEPYPGPFMRFDLLFRHRRQARASDGGATVADSGGDVTSVGATLAFRPRPALDFQLFLERPIGQDLNGLQLEEDLSIFFVIGVRL
jgi:hypothetical protein